MSKLFKSINSNRTATISYIWKCTAKLVRLGKVSRSEQRMLRIKWPATTRLTYCYSSSSVHSSWHSYPVWWRSFSSSSFDNISRSIIAIWRARRSSNLYHARRLPISSTDNIEKRPVPVKRTSRWINTLIVIEPTALSQVKDLQVRRICHCDGFSWCRGFSGKYQSVCCDRFCSENQTNQWPSINLARQDPDLCPTRFGR